MKNLKDKTKKIIIDILMIIFIIFLIIILTSCDSKTMIDDSKQDNTDSNISEYIDLKLICKNRSSTSNDRIYYDKNTGVMYYIGKFNGMQCGFPIYNSDGTLKLYEGD